jgi:FkbM family methyltransferase
MKPDRTTFQSTGLDRSDSFASALSNSASTSSTVRSDHLGHSVFRSGYVTTERDGYFLITRLAAKAIKMAVQRTSFRGYKLFFENEDATNSMIRAIDEFPSFFTPSDAEPLIIDCGANIGISVLEWKTRWPASRVICFEPDPNAFRLLEMNIELNGVPGVQCIHAAVADFDGPGTLFGDLGKGADARGNSLESAWGERAGASSIEVTCQRLAPYLADNRVALLKIDIEGAEERVLRDISQHLGDVDAIYVEVHETDRLVQTNSSVRVHRLLSSAGFTVESEPRFDPHALPPQLDSWRRSVGARQTQLLCWRTV